MSLRFIARSTDLNNAWYSRGGSQAGLFSNIGHSDIVVKTANASAGLFGGYFLNLQPASVIKGIHWPGGLNVVSAANEGGGAFSVLARLFPTVTPMATSQGIIEVGSANNANGGFRVYLTAAGVVVAQLFTEGGGILTYTGVNVFTPVVSQAFDIMVTWTGTTVAGGIKVSIDGVEHETMTAGTAVTYRDYKQLGSIITGSLANTSNNRMHLNELILWDSVEAHVYTPRTTFWDVPTYDGAARYNNRPAYIIGQGE